MSAPIVRRALALWAGVLALSAAIVGSPVPPTRTVATVPSDGARAVVTRTVDAVQLAAWIRDGARDLRVLDLRGDSAYESRHVPSAERADAAALDTLAPRTDATVVLYSDDDVRDAQAWANLAARGHPNAYVLSGGMPAWTDEVMEPVLHGDSADYVAALSRYFGGAPRASDRVSEPRAREQSNTTTDEFGATRRRGC